MRSTLAEESPARRKDRCAPKPRGRATTKPTSTLVTSQPDARLSRSFLDQAKKLDEELRATWRTIQKDIVRVGEILIEMKNKRMHIALGYPNFENYVQDACGQSKSSAFEAMRIVRELTTGPRALSPSEVAKMTRENAKRVINLKHKGGRVTSKIVEAAQTMPEKRFQEEIEAPALKKVGAAPAEGEVLQRLTLTLPKDIYDNLMEAHEICKWVARDDQRDIPLEEKAWDAMAAQIKDTYGAEYEQEQARQAETGVVTAEEASAAAAESEQHPPGVEAAVISAAEEAQKPTMHSKRKVKKASASEARPEASVAG